MTKTLRLLGFATLLATGTATATLAVSNNEGQAGSGGPAVTGAQLGSPQESRPTSNPGYTNPRTGNTVAPGMSAQSQGRSAQGTSQPDALHPNNAPPRANSEGSGSTGR